MDGRQVTVGAGHVLCATLAIDHRGLANHQKLLQIQDYVPWMVSHISHLRKMVWQRVSAYILLYQQTHLLARPSKS